MSPSEWLLLKIFYVSCIVCCKSEGPYSQDTYLNALQTSNQDVDGVKEGYNYSPNLNNYLPPSPSVYGPPAPLYGPPTPLYEQPSNVYKPISVTYPRDHWFLEKLKEKINIVAIGKLILKLLIFKKIIKFIGVICLLLFLPKLKALLKDNMSMAGDEMESKQVETEQSNFQL